MLPDLLVLGQKLSNAVGRGLIYIPASSLLKSRDDRALLHMAASRQHRQTRNCQPNTHPLHLQISLLERHAIASYLTLAEELVGVCLPCRIRLNLCALESCFALDIGHHQLSQLHQLL